MVKVFWYIYCVFLVSNIIRIRIVFNREVSGHKQGIYFGGQVHTVIFFSSNAYTQIPYFSHNFLNLTFQHQNQTSNLQNHTHIFGLQYFNFNKHFLQNTRHNSPCNTQNSNRKHLDILFQNQSPIEMPH